MVDMSKTWKDLPQNVEGAKKRTKRKRIIPVDLDAATAKMLRERENEELFEEWLLSGREED